MPDKTATATSRKAHSYKLPTYVTPINYQIKLLPDLKNFTFEGQESIDIEVHEATKQIVLNCIEIDVKSASITEEGSEFAGQVTLDDKNQRATILFPKQLPPGLKTLHLSFAGILNDKLHGFYRSRYLDSTGQEKAMATTQFEATDARRAFPCFDEPEYKATFDVTLVVDEDLTAISNGSLKSQKSLGNGKKEMVFNRTMKMSTYLVAFIIGELEGTDPIESADGTPIRIWALRGKKHLASFARDCAAATLSFFSHYYGIKYPADKLDLIAIPNFASGAMENLGAITFRETALLVDQESASHAELERIADVVAHENAHMWFGDLVTMKWWNGLWLNEAFATFMEMLAVDDWRPEWKRWESFSAARASAFAVDALHTTRAIEYPVKHPDEAGGMFDILTYVKGASVLRMLEQYLGPEQFRKGINFYLNKHQYANAETTDLWDALQSATKDPVRKVMDSWIFQGGYPLVSVEKTANGLSLQQQRFNYTIGAKGPTQIYQIPILLRAKAGPGVVAMKVLMSEPEMEVSLPGPVEWAVVNDGGHGFYQVHYSKPLLEALSESIQQIMAPVERFNLVSSAWATTLSGHTSLQEYLHLISRLTDEHDKNVWTAILGSLQYLNRIIDHTIRPKFEHFSRHVVKDAYERLGWKASAEESGLNKQLRGMLIGAMGSLANDPEVQHKSAEYYHAYKQDRSSADPDIIGAVIGTLATTGDAALYTEFFEQFTRARTPQEEQRFLSALSRFRKRDLIDRTLNYTLTGEIRTQDGPYTIAAVLMNVYCRGQGWDFMTHHWDELIEIFPVNSLSRMCGGIVSLVDEDLEKQVIEFFSRHEVPHAGKTIEQHLESLHVAVKFKEREAANLETALTLPA
jgi:puromycin-sensitive aminopeptidase